MPYSSRRHEIAELLAIVKETAAYPWIYPLVCMAAHTGARRGELIKMQVTDIDFGEEAVTIRDKKRIKGKRSTRQAPLTPLLKEALLAWLSIHPGGHALFCHGEEVTRSKKRSRTTGHQNGVGRATSLKGRMATVKVRSKMQVGHLTTSEMHYHFRKTLRESKWSVVNGAHVLRHSMIRCMAFRHRPADHRRQSAFTLGLTFLSIPWARSLNLSTASADVASRPTSVPSSATPIKICPPPDVAKAAISVAISCAFAGNSRLNSRVCPSPSQRSPGSSFESSASAHGSDSILLLRIPYEKPKRPSRHNNSHHSSIAVPGFMTGCNPDSRRR